MYSAVYKFTKKHNLFHNNIFLLIVKKTRQNNNVMMLIMLWLTKTTLWYI